MKKTIDKSVRLDLDGLDGNAFSLMAAFQKQAREDNWTDDEIETVIAEATSKDYRHLMAVLELYCEPGKENESS